MSTDRHIHRLPGCRPEPLGSYLKALGVLRLVAEQEDRRATGWWEGDTFVLSSALASADLRAFFLERYRPTPIVSPWNNSSGFGPEGKDELGAIERSEEPRLAPYREAIAVCRRLLSLRDDKGWDKGQLVAACRASLPDACVAWIDSAVVLTEAGPVYPPLLGTGGNDGRLEFSRNFHQRVLEVLGQAKLSPERVAACLGEALAATGEVPLPKGSSPGQFDGGAAGGPNSAPTGSADGVLNPWDWVLLVEGSLLFASGAARRLAAAAQGVAAAPFTVDSSPVGYASASSNERTRGELWAPLWGRPAPLAELRGLFGEARADWAHRHASSGLQWAEAAASLGTDRGIDAFSRHALVERNGQATVAVPVGRFAAARRPAVAPLDELDGEIGQVDRAGRAHELPHLVAARLRRLERVVFAVAEGTGSLAEALVAAADLDLAVASSPGLRESVRPLQLSAERWAPLLLAADDGPELRLALSLTSGRDPGGEHHPGPSLRALLLPSWEGRHLTPPPVEGLGRRPIVAVLADAHARRVVELSRAQRRAGTVPEQPGVPTRFSYGSAARLDDVAALAAGMLDEGLLSSLVGGCLLLRFSEPLSMAPAPPQIWVPPALGLLGPFYAAQPETESTAAGAPHPDAGSPGPRRPEAASAGPLRPEATWPALLAAGRAAPVVRGAWLRLRIAGIQPVADPDTIASGLDTASARRLGAALLCRLTVSRRNSLLSTISPDLEPTNDHEGAIHANA